MGVKPNGKRSAQAVQGPASKKRKVGSGPPSKKGLQKNGQKQKEKGKEKAADRGVIPVPTHADDDVELSDQDMDVLDAYGGAVSFLNSLDQKGITRSKKETERLHRLNRPAPKAPIDDDLPSIDSHDEDDDAWSSGLDDDLISAGPSNSGDSSLGGSEDEGNVAHQPAGSELDSDAEMPYETQPRKRRPSWDEDKKFPVQRLPIKLADGRIQKTGTNAIAVSETDESDDEEEEVPAVRNERWRVDDISTGGRFGRPAVIDVVGNKSRKAAVQGAKDQIAGICQEIVAEPENSLGLLRRLHTFSLSSISSPTHPEPVANDIIIRKLALLSQLAVFKDIIPGYRIRALTDKEKAEKVSQMVAQTREFEQGLLVVYQTYLRSLEAELKGKTELAEVALQCMCTLAAEVTHFNFRVNLMACIVAHLSKKSWDKSSDLCLNTIISVFRDDLTGVPSLEIVRLLNRMVKERKFNVHPEVLSCLIHLRLKTELGVRASESKADRNEDTKGKLHSKGRAAERRAKGKATTQPHLSKKAQKTMKEKKEIEKEFREAEAEVDKEERAVAQTEALKLLFVLYFRIIKNPRPTPLLPAALRGISKYAHMVNIDFFKDLMKVLKDLISREVDDEDEEVPLSDPKDTRDIQHRLLCIVTAFELLSGQGEALNIDLSDFIAQLYAIILPLGLLPTIEVHPSSSPIAEARGSKAPSVADMLFRALNIVFSPRTTGTTAPPWRSAAFAKRLLTASLNWPPATTLRTIDFVAGLVAKDPKLEALLSTEDRTADGVYRADIDDPQLCNPFGTSFWELHLLHRSHCDPRVRLEAKKLLSYERS